MSKVIIENEYVICELDDSIPVLKHKWLKNTQGQPFRDQLIEIQKAYVKLKPDYPNLKWLVDAVNLGELSSEDDKWLETEWQDILFKQAGVKVHAVILADDIYADYSMEKFKSMAAKRFEEDGIKLGVFLIEENAYKFLRED